MSSEREQPDLGLPETEATTESPQIEETLEDLRAEIDALTLQMKALGRKSTERIALAFIVPGALSLAASILVNSQVLAFIGLGLVFWGALFYLVRPVTYVRGSLLGLTAESLYFTIDRIINDLNCKGKALYIPPYPSEIYLPHHLKGLKETIVFISANENATMPSIEEIAQSKFMTKNPKGICLIPPGSSLLQQIERILRVDITRTKLEDLCATLPQLIFDNFQFAKEIQMKTENNMVYLKMTNSIYRNLYLRENLKTVKLLGCPLASALASAAAKSIGKPTYLHSVEVSPDAQTVQIVYAIMET
jgi:hypothetical protein